MASSLHRRASNLARCYRSAFLSCSRRWFSTADALVEVKPGEVGIVSGIPEEHLRRRVIIYSPARTATQQGSGKVGRWKINFLSTQKWENPLMGWTSTGDPYANVGEAGLSFDSEEAAKAFAEKHVLFWKPSHRKSHAKTVSGFDSLAKIESRIVNAIPRKVKKPHTPLLKPKSYADNFKWKGPAN